ncbi:unnamed protein product [Spirodela intermedia]|uniref:Uncharacterized protein n=2 Tax=Spirodela intermedia TaxID=51605 RepID=A0A7I8JQN3_SPIIN|nr:unnamed protein product [Spirodela intermedia]CAA6671742.1 unnamed protein product [Spirodela intermedia]CAA7408859.1 unnamed protein product [Spirodela intermedia]
MSSQDIRHKASEAMGQAQARKEEIADKASDACRSASQSCQEAKEKAGCLLQQTGEQMTNMAKSVADAATSALGVGSDNNPTCRR